MDATCFVCSAEGRFHVAGALGAAFINDAANWPWLRTSGYLAAGRGVVRVLAAEAVGFAISCFLSAWRLPAALSWQNVQGKDLAEIFDHGARCLRPFTWAMWHFWAVCFDHFGHIHMFRWRAAARRPGMNGAILLLTRSQVGRKLYFQPRAEYSRTPLCQSRFARQTWMQHLTGCYAHSFSSTRFHLTSDSQFVGSHWMLEVWRSLDAPQLHAAYFSANNVAGRRDAAQSLHSVVSR